MRKRFFSLLMAAVLLCPVAMCPEASAAGLTDHITVNSYDPGIDYMAAMLRALEDGSTYALQVGAIYEQQRNLKIGALQLPQKLTYYFTTYTTAAEILKAIEADNRRGFGLAGPYYQRRGRMYLDTRLGTAMCRQCGA